MHPQPPPAPQPQKKSTGKIIGIGCLGAFAFLFLLGIAGAIAGIGNDTAGSSTSPSASPSTAAPQESAAKEEKPTPAKKDKKKDKEAALPNLVGKGLQTAQDTAQEAGFFNLASHDSLGRGRNQVFDRNWKVCSQTPKPGTRSLDSEVDLGAVKLEEDCPAKDQKEPEKAGSRMPDFVGKSVSAARGALDPSTSITVEDASGDGRFVLLESNWKVCGQAPRAGAALSGQPVEFTAVKFEESCP